MPSIEHSCVETISVNVM